MAYRRVYIDTVRKWAIPLGLGSVPLIFLLFAFLSTQGDLVINGYSNTDNCGGTVSDPCIAIINFTAKKDIYVYPNESWTKFSSDQLLKEVKFQRSWGKGWREINLSSTWSSTVKYSVKFSQGQDYTVRILGYKASPMQNIKWSFGTLDPWWNTSYLYRTNFTSSINIPQLTISADTNAYWELDWDTATLTTAKMQANCNDHEIVDISNNQVNWQWDAYNNLTYGCDTTTTLVPGNSTVDTTNGTIFTSVYYGYSADTNLPNSTLPSDIIFDMGFTRTEGNGSFDNSRYAMHSSLAAGTFSQRLGLYGYGIEGTGSERYTVSGADDVFTHLGNYTLIAFVKPDTTATGVNEIIAKTDQNSEVALYGNDLFCSQYDTVTQRYGWTTDNFVTAGKWYAITCRFTQGSDALAVAFDGSTFYRNSGTFGTLLNSASATNLLSVGGTNFFDGVVDRILVFNRSLTDNEINATMAMFFAKNYTFITQQSEESPADSTIPTWSSNTTNSTLAGTWVNHTVTLADNTALDWYIFEFDNGTGTSNNDTAVDISGTSYIANTTKRTNSTTSSTIKWRYYFNDTSNNWNKTDLFDYLTTEQTVALSFIIFQDGQPIERKFEYQRSNVNITVLANNTGDFCVDFNGTGFENQTCFASTNRGELKWDVGEYKAKKLSDGSISKNVSIGMAKNVTINLTAFRNISSSFINLTGYYDGVNVSEESDFNLLNSSYGDTGFPTITGDVDWNGSHILVASHRPSTAVNFIDIFNSSGWYVTNCTYDTSKSNFAGGVATNGSHIVVNGFGGIDGQFDFMVLDYGCNSIKNVTSTPRLNGDMDWNGTNWIVRSQITANASINIYDGNFVHLKSISPPNRNLVGGAGANSTGIATIKDKFFVIPVSVNYKVAWYDYEGNNIFNDTVGNTGPINRGLNLEWDGIDFTDDGRMIVASQVELGYHTTKIAYIEDMTIDLNGDNIFDAILSGRLNGSQVQVKTFTTKNENELILFPISGSSVYYLNFSTAGMNFSNINQNLYRNLTFQIRWQNPSAVTFNFIENFTNDKFLNLTATNTSFAGRYGMWVYEDFSGRPINVTNRWIRYDLATPTDSSWSFDTANNLTKLQADNKGGGGGVSQKLRTSDIDFKYFHEITTNISGSVTGDGGTATITVGLRNDNTTGEYTLVQFIKYNGENFNETIKFNRTGDTFTGYRNGVLSNSFTIAENNYSLFYRGQIVSGPWPTSLTLNILSINASGVRGNYSQGMTYKNSTIRSGMVVNSTSGIDHSIAVLEADYIAPTGTSINWYLSADNGTTWEVARLNIPHIFTNKGKGLEWRADLFTNVSGNESSGFPNISPLIRKVRLYSSTGNVSNLAVDVGNDGFNESQTLGQFNDTNSPINVSVNSSAISGYIYSNCATVKTCTVPVKFLSDSAGIINVTNIFAPMNATKLNILLMNRTIVDDVLNSGKSQLNISFANKYLGMFEISNITFQYPDDANYTINVTASSGYSGSNSTRIITRYSKFIERVLDPFGWGIFPTSANATEVPAEMQNSSRGVFNLTGNATWDSFTLFFKQNEIVHSSLNITFSNTSSASNGFNMSLNYQPILNNVSNNGGFGIWTWGYFNNSPTGIFLPNISYSAVCQNCIRGAGSP